MKDTITVTFQETGNVTSPSGFQASGVAAAIKKPGRLDMALIYSEKPCNAAAVYTTNKVQAAPLTVTREHIAAGALRAVVINAGNANACTGEQGLENARTMATKAGIALGLKAQEVAVSSTGVIGQQMPMERIVAGIEKLSQSLSNEGYQAAEAIMTTDLVPKTGKVELSIGEQKITIGAMAKGSGMIHPNMATMLAFYTTDAKISKPLLEKAMKKATKVSYNMISVDGDTSTNDMALILANGTSLAPAIEAEGPLYDAFEKGLIELSVHLAKAIARDGEGATKLVGVHVKGAKTEEDAQKAARTVISSSLFKSAIFGADANWGRILCAIGYSGADFDPSTVDIYLGDIQTARDGEALDFSEEKAVSILSQREVTITADLKNGQAEARAWGCDLTYEYVKINADYRT
ncbi:bifunctional glutamate N-acetyltransferase/amino-acid acetyltransferase ArgJ [Heliorestis acidaminivorans]|uniref:Arginine biosynthesis bifunctional protein ArgJ n=1 Tax=Heliorestis acidaminivorans TaxID=553427 RepID=A0A6I0EZL2_9FIRM|nr:bifunctional glutamate N-acetyltransferase/amino-acid acetyltransferase ArgJ [Heliorestis acidaminivorans]KAB2951374.1 bifunctional glutamate N-acetyltransferase/amino-acid acetyltransferase ArgJ [Heliorestis acidaminivorans]